ncbi:PaaI family thioesterase [Camelimonas abortus]|uniref:PaaI family thioesterase n=1 Tax=Camelimonas abortus TaxID=1017184 RepID=A0ABV7LGV4_9HYPH
MTMVTLAPVPDNASDASRPLPPGFRPLRIGSHNDFLGLTGPFAMKEEDGLLKLGFHVEQRHCNIAGICHGGMMLTFADIQMAVAGKYQENLQGFHMTVSLACDFLGAGRLGGWVEGRTEVVRNVDRLLYAQCIVTCDGEPVLRGNAVFREGKATPEMIEKMRIR